MTEVAIPAGPGTADILRRIAVARAALDSQVVILGHHYQRDEVIRFADHRGDSLQLARWAASQRQARQIVFCGVHFMAETASILAQDHQQVLLPDPTAGCTMADMVTGEALAEAWDALTARYGPGVIPVAYVNSTAEVKAFCGEHGGAACTSSNAVAILRWALGQGRRVLFVPDEHLGRNAGRRLGLGDGDMAVWDPRAEDPAETADPAGAAPVGRPGAPGARGPRLILWRGFCAVHRRFSVEQVRAVRERHPGVVVVVHPECRAEVAQAADLVGSTDYIIRQVAAGEPGSSWAIGTEINLVERLAREYPDREVVFLGDRVWYCPMMMRITPANLLGTLENLRAGRVVNEVKVAPEVAAGARLALERMLAIS